MTTDYERGLEDAAKALEGLNVSSTSGPIERAMRLVQSEGAARIRSLAPAQGVVTTGMCDDCYEDRGKPHHPDCAYAIRPAPPLVHVDDGQGFRKAPK